MSRILIAIICMFASLSLQAADYGDSCRAGDAAVVAIAGGRPLTSAELEELAGPRLMKIRSEEYKILRDALEDLVNLTLSRNEADERGISFEALMNKEVYDRIAPVSPEEARAAVDLAPQNYAGKTPEEALRSASDTLRGLRVASRRKEFFSEIRRSTLVQVLLEPPRIKRQFTGGQSAGPETAPVTIVEFSDFQCPYCAKLSTVLAQLRKAYEGRVRLTFMQFPLPMHAQAGAAAEAALCAAEQGNFWGMHDSLFGNQSAVAGKQFAELAGQIGLDGNSFELCMASHKTASQYQKEVAEGRQLGISATPSLFINGRMLTGAVPYETLRDIVEEELARNSRVAAMQVPSGSGGELP